MTKSITILIPTYNEEEVLPKLHKRLTSLVKSLPNYSFELLFVNDGSTDGSLKLIKNFAKKDTSISYVNLSRNFGKEIAMIAGIDHVQSDALVIIDADLQDPPELIPDMIKLWEEGYDDVYARRAARIGESWLKRKTSSWFYRILQRSTNIQIQRDTGDFRLLDRRCVQALQQLRESERYTKGLFSWIGYRKKEISYVRDPRVAGATKWNYFKLINLAVDGFVSFTTAPLRFSTILGMTVSFLAFIYIIYLIARTLLYGADIAGYPSTMAAILFLGGVQLLSLGIIGEYVGRIFHETKQRPLYFVDEYHKKKSKK
ncbi:MAG: glycosyltransferase family 2 protein [Candidatus Nomurabacteria bacterium]|nr:MAG: glycosyltransferase family 2 protein [Candidatus Nomurabacteria bacterium]